MWKSGYKISILSRLNARISFLNFGICVPHRITIENFSDYSNLSCMSIYYEVVDGFKRPPNLWATSNVLSNPKPNANASVMLVNIEKVRCT
jgi:hypothetical protein